MVGYYSLGANVRSTDDGSNYNHPFASHSSVMKRQVDDSTISRPISQPRSIKGESFAPAPRITEFETKGLSTAVEPLKNGTTSLASNFSTYPEKTISNFLSTTSASPQSTQTTNPSPTLKPTEKPLPTCPEYIKNSGTSLPCWLLREGTCYCFSTFRVISLYFSE